MNKNIVTKESSLFSQEVRLIIDTRSSGIDLTKIAPVKQAKIKEALKGVKIPR